ncbi:MAG: hypothetical protein AB1791_02995 [Chloroflexota bacterium]
MTDVYIVTLSLIGILISLPALLVALNLLLPTLTGHAYTRLARTPGRCFVLGLPVALGFIVWMAITTQARFGLLRSSAFLVAVLGMGLGTLGAAGLARLLGERIGRQAATPSSISSLVRGALVYELACLVPGVGWLLFAPLAGITVLGAAVFAVLGWLPRPEPVPVTSPNQVIANN